MSVVGRGVGCGFTTIYLLPSTYGFSVFSRTTGSVARGDKAGVGLLTVGGFILGPQKSSSSGWPSAAHYLGVAIAAAHSLGVAVAAGVACSFWLLTPSVRGFKSRSS